MTRGRPRKTVKTVPRKKEELITHKSEEDETRSDHEDIVFMVHDSLKVDLAQAAEGATDSEDEGLSEWDEDDEKLTAALREMEVQIEMEDGEWENLTREERKILKRKASSIGEFSCTNFTNS
jgi:hypothetical protein